MLSKEYERREMKKSKKEMKGFTLIELMIVILIIAILVAIAVPVFLSARANAQRRSCQANLRTIDGMSNALYFVTEDGSGNHYYPTNDAFFAGPEDARQFRTVPRCPRANGLDYTWNVDQEPYFASCPTELEDHKYP